ncbi:MAG: thioredoxin family protein [Isosphaeraceae bacterium]
MADADLAEPSRDEINRLIGPLVLEFGASWCPHCRQLESRMPALLARFPGIPHRKIEDAAGRPLGRSFRVKLWPTLVFLLDGVERARAVRPGDDEVAEGLAAIAQRRMGPPLFGQDSIS